MNAIRDFLIENNIEENLLDSFLKKKLTSENLQNDEFVKRLKRYSKMNQKLMEMGYEPLKLEQEDNDLNCSVVNKAKKNVLEEMRSFLWQKIDEWVSTAAFTEEECKASALGLSLRQYFCVKGNNGSLMGIPLAKDVFVKLRRNLEPGSSFVLSKKQKHCSVQEYLKKRLSNIADRKLRFPEEIHFFERDYLSTVLFLKKARQCYHDSSQCGQQGRGRPQAALISTCSNGNQ
jgi:hypothetical protein